MADVASKSGIVIVSLILVGTLYSTVWAEPGVVVRDQNREHAAAEKSEAVSEEAAAHRTALAGEPLRLVFMGRSIDVPAMDRSSVNAITLGGAFYTPKQGETSATPIGALFINRVREEYRTRNVISGFVNDLEYDRSFGNIELVARLENNNILGGQREVVNNREVKSSDAVWGTVIVSAGPGLRYKVAPFQTDNDLRLQLLGKVGYFYADRTNDTGPNLVLPPSTMLYGAKLRGRYDGIRRNLMELPHTGMAAGFDLDYMYRAKWADFGTIPEAVFTKSDTRDYLQFNGYLMWATGIPGLSEKKPTFPENARWRYQSEERRPLQRHHHRRRSSPRRNR